MFVIFPYISYMWHFWRMLLNLGCLMNGLKLQVCGKNLQQHRVNCLFHHITPGAHDVGMNYSWWRGPWTRGPGGFCWASPLWRYFSLYILCSLKAGHRVQCTLTGKGIKLYFLEKKYYRICRHAEMTTLINIWGTLWGHANILCHLKVLHSNFHICHCVLSAAIHTMMF